MYLLILQVDCFLNGVKSLKAKRSIRHRLIQGLQNTFPVNVAEVARADTHQRLVLGLCSVSGDVHYLQSLPEKIRSFLDQRLEGYISNFEWECIRWG